MKGGTLWVKLSLSTVPRLTLCMLGNFACFFSSAIVGVFIQVNFKNVWRTSGLPGAVYDVRLNLNILLVK